MSNLTVLFGLQCLCPAAFVHPYPSQRAISPGTCRVRPEVKSPPPRRQSERRIFTNWGVYGNQPFYAQNITTDTITHILYAFGDCDGQTGMAKLSDTYSDQQMHFDGDTWDESVITYMGNFKQLYALKLKHRTIKVLLSIGGWTKRPGNLCQQSIALMEDNGLDGIDIDYEYPETPEQASGVIGLRIKYGYCYFMVYFQRRSGQQDALGIPLYGRSFQNTAGIHQSYSGVGTGSAESGIYDYKALPPDGSEVVENKLWYQLQPIHQGACFIRYSHYRQDEGSTLQRRDWLVKNLGQGGASASPTYVPPTSTSTSTRPTASSTTTRSTTATPTTSSSPVTTTITSGAPSTTVSATDATTSPVWTPTPQPGNLCDAFAPVGF
ncbi:chitinase [Rhizoctonia solani]|uniref:Chitinase n=1 Tax=Rhizoctonia solani TaxID=456999 RepID=A0A8H8NXZ7_9AGAM|nr:chitinase [Rhizoctonia solani]QRW20827.1 chitinase [Rhizoctonia solani]